MHTRQAIASLRRSSHEASKRLDTSFGETSRLLSSKMSSSSNSSYGGSDVEAFKNMLFSNPLNLLLLLGPLATWSHYGNWNQTTVFILNFLVLVPLANILGNSTESLASHTGSTIGGLVNATFGNAVEVVVSIFALLKGEVAIVQSSLVGSVLSNLLLVLGTSFIAGGIVNKENFFNARGANANSSLLMLASFAMLLPSYIFYYSGHDTEHDRMEKTLMMSYISAICLLCMYIQLLVFQLYTHHEMFADNEDDEEEPDLSFRGSGIVLLISTLLVAIFSEALVSSIDGFAKGAGLNRPFIGIILLPIVGNAVEHVTAVKVALNNKMELAMGVAVGSATQVSVFVVPVVVLAGWVMGVPMSLAFPMFEILIYMMSVIIVYAIIADGRSHWLGGSMLLTAYFLVAISLCWVHVPTHAHIPTK